MQPDAKYIKTNVTPVSNRVLKLLSAERGQYIYEVIEEELRKDFPEYFEKIECKTKQNTD